MVEIVGKHYVLQQKIGQGSFGKIHIAEDKNTGEKYAVKLEDVNTNVPQLMFESRIYQIMSGSVNVPRLHYQCEEPDRNVMVIDLMGKSIEALLTQCGRRFSIKTVCMLADQMISSIEFFHSKNYIHRDLKPDNFVIGRGKQSNQVFIIDYGLAKRYRDQNTHHHIKFITGKSLTGTARYASINALAGCEQSRRDDIEDLAYVLIYLCKGTLPWMGIQAKDRKEKYAKICNIKRTTPIEVLCEGLPAQFADFLMMARAMSFEEEPKYYKYKKMFRDLLLQIGATYDYRYDWCTENETEPAEIVPNKVIRPKRRNRNLTLDSIDKIESIEAVRSGEFLSVDDKVPGYDSPLHKVPKYLLPEVKPGVTVTLHTGDGFPSLDLSKENTLETAEDKPKTKDPVTRKRKLSKQKKRKVSNKGKTNDVAQNTIEAPQKITKKKSRARRTRDPMTLDKTEKVKTIYNEKQEEDGKRQGEEARRLRENKEKHRLYKETRKLRIEEEKQRSIEIARTEEQRKREREQRRIEEERIKELEKRRRRDEELRKQEDEDRAYEEKERRRRRKERKQREQEADTRRRSKDEEAKWKRIYDEYDDRSKNEHHKRHHHHHHRSHEDEYNDKKEKVDSSQKFKSPYRESPQKSKPMNTEPASTQKMNIVDKFLLRVGAK